ncbi:MAG: AzlC family ABC transporter permease [Clostridia bacterium]|nr:AzlC family ABC transporter permease [Clostridia bacterium]
MSELSTRGKRLEALRIAFPHTIPIMAGYLFLGFAHGILMAQDGFSFLWPMGMAVTIFGGSMEYYAAEELLHVFAPLSMLMMVFIIQSRHLFYGIAMLEKYKSMGNKRFYLIFGLTDETFSVNSSLELPLTADRGWVYFFVTLLDHCYWVTGCTVGGLFGTVLMNAIPGMDQYTTGLDFVMTALFAVILLEQLLKEKKHYTALIGAGASLGCLIVFGASTFMVPAMICILLLLTVFRGPLEKAGGLE